MRNWVRNAWSTEIPSRYSCGQGDGEHRAYQSGGGHVDDDVCQPDSPSRTTNSGGGSSIFCIGVLRTVVLSDAATSGLFFVVNPPDKEGSNDDNEDGRGQRRERLENVGVAKSRIVRGFHEAPENQRHDRAPSHHQSHVYDGSPEPNVVGGAACSRQDGICGCGCVGVVDTVRVMGCRGGIRNWCGCWILVRRIAPLFRCHGVDHGISVGQRGYCHASPSAIPGSD